MKKAVFLLSALFVGSIGAMDESQEYWSVSSLGGEVVKKYKPFFNKPTKNCPLSYPGGIPMGKDKDYASFAQHGAVGDGRPEKPASPQPESPQTSPRLPWRVQSPQPSRLPSASPIRTPQGSSVVARPGQQMQRNIPPRQQATDRQFSPSQQRPLSREEQIKAHCRSAYCLRKLARQVKQLEAEREQRENPRPRAQELLPREYQYEGFQGGPSGTHLCYDQYGRPVGYPKY